MYLVGAGPGDPGLITVRGRELLERADLVVYDSLVDESLLGHAAHAEHVFVGKRDRKHTLDQSDINRFLIDNARRGLCVVRLKGGDPFVFGRGGEEMLALAAANVAFEIVPGVSAGNAAPAFAGIPLTHRNVSSRVTFLSAHDIDDWTLGGIEPGGTIVVFMGSRQVAEIARKLMDAGWNGEAPMAVISRASQPEQSTIVTTLGDAETAIGDAPIATPAVIVAGEVVRVREGLQWTETRPLSGRRVVVTRTKEGASELLRLLHESGAEVMEFTTVQFESPPIVDMDLTDFDWIVLSSPNAVNTLLEHLRARNSDARALHGVKLCAVGEKAQKALADYALQPDALIERHDTEFVLEQFVRAAGDLHRARVLLPRADIARATLAVALRSEGAQVTELDAFHAAIPEAAAEEADEVVAFAPHYVTFMGTAAPRNFARILGAERLAALRDTTTYAAIGAVTANAAAEADLDVRIVPSANTTAGLVAAIAAYDQAGREGVYL